MKSFIRYQIIPLTLKQLKQAQIQCKQSKSKAFENSTYEYIEVIARVTKSTSFDITICDQTDSIRLPLMANIIRKAADIVVNRYYKVTLAAKKSFSSDGFPYEVESMLWVDPNEVTLHMLRCLKEKMRRQECMEQSQGRNRENDDGQMNTDSTINDSKQSSKSSSVSNSTGNNSSSSSSRNTLLNKVFEDILDYVRGLKQDFDADIILAQFDGRVSKPQVEEWIEDMCEKGQIMNLGMVYEWAGDEEE